ncbi:hypothetical protein BDQ17DRAFT_1352923 [Cyathus striatus]|nr:hypothetical protein BDQ17DRAFT_1352923 [Cyathus striatus]
MCYMFSSVWTYLPTDAPDFHEGNLLNLVNSCAVIVIILAGSLYLRMENAKRERGERDYRIKNRTQLELEEIRYLHPQFRYKL